MVDFYVALDQRAGHSAYWGSLPLSATRLTTYLILFFTSETSAGFGRYEICPPDFSTVAPLAHASTHLAVSTMVGYLIQIKFFRF